MTIICTLDIETTGFDKETDFITELAWSIKPHGVGRSFVDKRHYIKGAAEVPENITDITGINIFHTEKFGLPLEVVINELLLDLRITDADYMCAHNKEFDKNFIETKAPQIIGKTPLWICTLYDIPWPESFRCLQLGHLAAEFGFLNPFPHNGISDVWTTAKLLDSFLIEEVIARSKSPNVVIYADVDYENREKAKEERFRWEGLGDKKYAKSWVKLVKKCDYHPDNYQFKTKVIDTW